VRLEQRIMIGPEMSRCAPATYGGVEHEADAQSDKLSSGGSPKRALVSAAAIVVAAAAPTALSRLGKRNRRAAEEYVVSVETIL
jgi:hypothetical protein